MTKFGISIERKLQSLIHLKEEVPKFDISKGNKEQNLVFLKDRK